MLRPRGPAMARSYDNRRRSEQARENRDRILQAAQALLAEAPVDAFTIPAIAQRAGVSVPTLYRNFASRDELLLALNEVMQQHMSVPAHLADTSDLPQLVRRHFDWFEDQRELLVAAQRSSLLGEALSAGQRQRDQGLVGF